MSMSRRRDKILFIRTIVDSGHKSCISQDLSRKTLVARQKFTKVVSFSGGNWEYFHKKSK